MKTDAGDVPLIAVGSDLKNCINDHCKTFPTCIWS